MSWEFRVFPRGVFPVFGRVGADAQRLENEELLSPVVLRVAYSQSDGILQAATGDTRDPLGVAQERGCMPDCPGQISSAQAGYDVSDAVGQTAHSAEENASFFIGGVVGACHGEASEVPGLVELVQDASNSAVCGRG